MSKPIRQIFFTILMMMLNNVGEASFADSEQPDFDFEIKVRRFLEPGEEFSDGELLNLRNQVLKKAATRCSPSGNAHQLDELHTYSRQLPYAGEVIEVTGRFVCIDGGDSDKFQVRGGASAWNADSGRLFEAAYENMLFNADLVCKEREQSAKISSDPIYGGDNFSVANVTAWFICTHIQPTSNLADDI